jgi:DNA-binding MarR family transcriptional regulator
MAPPPRDTLAASLQRFGLERDRMRAALTRRVGISATDLNALEHLESDGPMTQRDLGDRLSLTSGAITMLVDRLEQAGWVHRRPHPNDRRYLIVELAPAATEFAPAELHAYHEAIRALAAGVPADQREIIRAFLQAAAASAFNAAEELRHAPPRRARPREPS